MTLSHGCKLLPQADKLNVLIKYNTLQNTSIQVIFLSNHSKCNLLLFMFKSLVLVVPKIFKKLSTPYKIICMYLNCQ